MSNKWGGRFCMRWNSNLMKYKNKMKFKEILASKLSNCQSLAATLSCLCVSANWSNCPRKSPPTTKSTKHNNTYHPRHRLPQATSSLASQFHYLWFTVSLTKWLSAVLKRLRSRMLSTCFFLLSLCRKLKLNRNKKYCYSSWILLFTSICTSRCLSLSCTWLTRANFTSNCQLATPNNLCKLLTISSLINSCSKDSSLKSVWLYCKPYW